MGHPNTKEKDRAREFIHKLAGVIILAKSVMGEYRITLVTDACSKLGGE
jgi:hypothetical protein